MLDSFLFESTIVLIIGFWCLIWCYEIAAICIDRIAEEILTLIEVVLRLPTDTRSAYTRASCRVFGQPANRYVISLLLMQTHT